MNILVVSGNFLPISPAGAAYIAGAALEAGHRVEVFDCLFAGDDFSGFEACLDMFEPDVVALSIPIATIDVPDRNFGTNSSHPDIRPKLKLLVETVKRKSNAFILVGGAGFNYFSTDWLRYLDLEYGIRGEAESSFPLFLSRLSKGESLLKVPGAIVKSTGRIFKEPRDRIMDMDTVCMPAYHLFDTDKYNKLKIPWGVSTKRGCSFDCNYCLTGAFEGRTYRFKSPFRVVKELGHVVQATGSNAINFSDNSFNCPIIHVKSLCSNIIDAGLDLEWRAGTFKPLGISRQFCQLLKMSGCSYVGLSLETASSRMLSNLNRGYRVEDIISSLDNLKESDIDFGVSILVGAPGETMASIQETFAILDGYPEIRAIWVNIGVFGWKYHLQKFRGKEPEPVTLDDEPLFQGAYYISPELGEEDMTDLIDALNQRKNCLVQVNKPWAG